MTKWRAFWRSFHKNVVVKRKYKAFALLMLNPTYRAQINNLYRLTRHVTKCDLQEIELSDIVPGHMIVYHSYAVSLVFSSGRIPPIRVVFDSDLGKYVVVDGNHRLVGILGRQGRSGKTICEVIS